MREGILCKQAQYCIDPTADWVKAAISLLNGWISLYNNFQAAIDYNCLLFKKISCGYQFCPDHGYSGSIPEIFKEILRHLQLVSS